MNFLNKISNLWRSTAQAMKSSSWSSGYNQVDPFLSKSLLFSRFATTQRLSFMRPQSLPMRATRSFTSTPPKEHIMREQLERVLNTKNVLIEDTSGGCGAFYKIEVSSPEFQGKSLIQQHQMVKKILSEHLKDIHGLTLKTKSL